MDQRELIEKLFSLQDEKYRQMQVKLLPNVSPERIIGVRTPQLRALAKQMTAGEAFLRELPHTYFKRIKYTPSSSPPERTLRKPLPEWIDFYPM